MARQSNIIGSVPWASAPLARKFLNGLDRMGRAAPSEKFEFVVFERVRGSEKVLQLVHSPCWQAPHVLQSAFKRRTVGLTAVLSLSLQLGPIGGTAATVLT